MRCEKCNTEMNYFQEAQTCGWSCPSCGNSIATSYLIDMQLDETLYTLILEPNTSSLAYDLKVISKLLGISILEAKKFSSTGGVIATGKAVLMKDCLEKLKQTNLKYTIQPEFIY